MLKRRLINLSIPVEQTTLPDHPKSHAAGFTTPTDTKYKPGSVVIIGSHCGKMKNETTELDGEEHVFDN